MFLDLAATWQETGAAELAGGSPRDPAAQALVPASCARERRPPTVIMNPETTGRAWGACSKNRHEPGPARRGEGGCAMARARRGDAACLRSVEA